MTDNFNKTEDEIRLIGENCDKITKQTEQELFLYKTDKIKLKNEILKILQENNLIHNEIRALKNEPRQNNEDVEKHKKLTNNAIEKLNEQVQYLKDERDTLNSLWKSSQGTIVNLESEINNYRKQLSQPNSINDIKQKYIDTIKILENSINGIKKELHNQVQINRELVKSKQILVLKVQEFERKFQCQELTYQDTKNIQNSIESLKKQLILNMKTNSDLEKSLKNARKIIDERFVREKAALDKVQEALQIAEIAIKEKNEALNKELVTREECDHLATTISEVMEDAAAKVEKNIAKLKANHKNEIKKLHRELKQTEEMLENQNKSCHLIELRAQSLEKKLKEILAENLKLDTDLQVASQAIVELEIKLEAIESLIDQEKKNHQLIGDNVEIHKLLECNKILKQRWKSTLEDVSKKFEIEIFSLQSENTVLKADIQELKLKLEQYE